MPAGPDPVARRVAAVLTVALAIAAYAPSLAGGFVFDDHLLVEGSPLLSGPLWRIWFTTDPVDYWPLTSTSLWVEWRLFGASPAGYRIVSLALHVAVALLLARVLESLRVPGASLAGLIFAVHPVAVESVAWISERKNGLSGVLFLGAALAWLAFREDGRARTAAAAAGAFAGSLLAKTSTVMLPVVLLGFERAQGRRPTRREGAWLAALFGLAAAFGAITLWFQWLRSMGGIGLGRGLAERVGGAGWAWATYLWTSLQPFAAAVVYPAFPGARTALLWLPLAALLALAASLWALRGRIGRGPLLALAFHGAMVLPVLGLLDMAFLVFSPVGNHLQYLALMGPVALVAHGLARLGERRWRKVAIALSAGIVVLLGTRTFQRSAAYRDDVSLWSRAVREAPRSLTAARMLAGALADAGRPREALAALEAAAARLRDPADAGRARALLLAQLDREDEAFAAERAATALRPDLGFQFELGVILSRNGRPDLAAPLLEDLVRRQPRSATNRYQLASALARSGRLEEAASHLEVGCRLSPRRSGACPALAMVLVRLGRGAEARGAVAEAMGVAPTDPAVDEALRTALPGREP